MFTIITATSTHTAIISMETHAMGRQQRHTVEIATENEGKQES